MSIFRQAIILAALVAFAITATAATLATKATSAISAAVIENGLGAPEEATRTTVLALVAPDQAIMRSINTPEIKSKENLATMQDIVKVSTTLTGVVGLAGALCMGLAKKRKELVDSRIVKALVLFPSMPLAVHLLGALVISQMH